MSNLETATKYGVATYETSKILDWQKETLFCYAESEKLGVILIPTDDAMNCGYEFILAPQMHEIAPFLRVCFHYKREEDKHSLCYVLQQYNFSRVGYFADNWGTCVSVFGLDIQAPYIGGAYPLYNTAEAYAKLFIKLRDAGFLEKEAL